MIGWGTSLCAALIFSIAQHKALLAHEWGRLLLPPHQPFVYFVGLVGVRYWFPLFVSIGIGTAFYLWATHYNAKKQGSIFYQYEPWLGAAVIGSIPWPASFFFVVLFILAFVVLSLVYALIRGAQERVSTRFFWIPVALFAILISVTVLQEGTLWNLLVL